MTDVIEVSDNSFDMEVLESKVPVIVDFSADWCGPCKRQLPILQKFAGDHADSVKVVTVDIEECPNITSRFGVKSVPTLLFFYQGHKVEMKIGLTTAPELATLLQKITA